jgi:catechol 2,3-dioxygenase-like lactoylglutathione lyase family enzyme
MKASTLNLNQVTVPALNIAASVDFYSRLGLKLIVSSPHYARFECPDGAASFSVHFVSEIAAPSQTVVYFELELLDEKVLALQQAGLVFSQLPKDESWLWREARLADPSGNVICLYWAGVNRLNPPWRVSGSDKGG